MTGCIYCRKPRISPNHSCRTMKAQKRLEPYQDLLYKWFVVEKRSIYSVETTANDWFGEKISGRWLRDWCRLHDVKTMTIKEVANLSATRQKYVKTVQLKYGVKNVSQSIDIKHKKQQTNIERYGVDNPFKRPEVQQQVKDVLISKYGVTNARHLPRSPDRTMLSAPHKKISKWLTEQGVIHVNEKPNLFPKSRSKNNRIYSPIVDIWIESHKTVIEIYGDYWHANPRYYHPTDILHLFIGPTAAKDIWDIDKQRKDHIESFGVKIIELWEHDIKNSFDTVTTMLYDMLIDTGDHDEEATCDHYN